MFNEAEKDDLIVGLVPISFTVDEFLNLYNLLVQVVHPPADITIPGFIEVDPDVTEVSYERVALKLKQIVEYIKEDP